MVLENRKLRASSSPPFMDIFRVVSVSKKSSFAGELCGLIFTLTSLHSEGEGERVIGHYLGRRTDASVVHNKLCTRVGKC
jgi:hypothetical protein